MMLDGATAPRPKHSPTTRPEPQPDQQTYEELSKILDTAQSLAERIAKLGVDQAAALRSQSRALAEAILAVVRELGVDRNDEVVVRAISKYPMVKPARPRWGKHPVVPLLRVPFSPDLHRVAQRACADTVRATPREDLAMPLRLAKFEITRVLMPRSLRRRSRVHKALAGWQRITSQYPRVFAHWAWTSNAW